jgi:hypothetical protein
MKQQVKTYLIFICLLLMSGYNHIAASGRVEVVFRSSVADIEVVKDNVVSFLSKAETFNVSFLSVSSEGSEALDPIEVEEDDFFYFKKHLKDNKFTTLHPAFMLGNMAHSFDKHVYSVFQRPVNRPLYLMHLALRL